MEQNYDFKIDKIKDLSPKEISLRKKNLELFYQTGFPNKKEEDLISVEIKQTVWSLPRLPAIEVHRVILDTLAGTGFSEHF